MFGKYFRNEKISYLFPCFAPFLLLLEIELYVGSTQRPGLEIWEILDELLEPLLLSIGCVMLGAQIQIQIISSIYFFCKIRRLSEQQKEELRHAARYSTKTGRILQTEDIFENMYGCGSDYIKTYFEEREIDEVGVLGTVDCGERYKQEYYFCYIGNLDDWEIGKTYRVQYLKNTGIVVGFEEVKR